MFQVHCDDKRNCLVKLWILLPTIFSIILNIDIHAGKYDNGIIL